MFLLITSRKQKLDGPSLGRPQPRVTGKEGDGLKNCGFGQDILGPFFPGGHGHSSELNGGWDSEVLETRNKSLQEER